jgi:hypothetical protein
MTNRFSFIQTLTNKDKLQVKTIQEVNQLN